MYIQNGFIPAGFWQANGGLAIRTCAKPLVLRQPFGMAQDRQGPGAVSQNPFVLSQPFDWLRADGDILPGPNPFVLSQSKYERGHAREISGA